MRLKRIGLALLAIAAAILLPGLALTFHEPGDLYASTHEFAGCPSRPSCVSSKAADSAHHIEPLRYNGDAGLARMVLEQVVRAQPRARIDHATPDYLHAVFQTPTMHFHDDVELLIAPGGIIDVRSISRFAYHDHEVNRDRVEALREAFEAALPVTAPPR